MNKILNELVGENNWKAFCISLERCQERRANFSNWANDVDLSFQFWNATDKNTLEEAFVKVNNILNLGATACSLSHYHLYKYLLKTYDCKYFFILEDDCGFKNSNKQELNTNQFNLTIQFCNKRNKYFSFLDLKTSNEKRNSYFTNCNEDKKELIKKVIELI